MQPSIRRIVVRSVDNFGDMIIALPVIEALRANYPKAKLTLMVKEEHRVLCQALADSFIDPLTLEQFPDIATLYDLAFNIAYFRPEKEQSRSLRRGTVHHINAVRGSHRRQITRHLLDGVAIFGLNIPRAADPKFKIPPNVRTKVRHWLKDACVGKKMSLWIGIHVGSRQAPKQWPLEKFTTLSLWLQRSFEARLFFFSSEEEEKSIRIIHEKLRIGDSEIVIGHPFDFVAGVLARMDFVIGNDSGIAHLASAVKTPTVSIFGPSSPALWRPAGKKSIVVYKNPSNIRKNIATQNHTHSVPILSVEEVKQGVLLCIQRHIHREDFAPLDYIRLSRGVNVERPPDGVVVRASKLKSACLVKDGWRRVRQILGSVPKHNSYSEALRLFPDAGALLDLFILHGIIRQGY